MSDVHDIATRSCDMSRIKETDTKAEILVRKYKNYCLTPSSKKISI